MRRVAVFALAVSALQASACSKPEAPKLDVDRAVVKSVGPTGVVIELTIDAKNPNAIPLRANKVKADVKLANQIDLGEVSVDTTVKIPAHGHAKIVVPMKLEWKELTSIGVLAATRPEVPFAVDGTAAIGGDSVSFDVPFRTEGALTQAQVVSIGAGALPTLPSALPKLF